MAVSAWLANLVFQRSDQRSFLSTDKGSRSELDLNIEVETEPQDVGTPGIRIGGPGRWRWRKRSTASGYSARI